MVAELPRKVPQPEHVLEELFHGGFPWWFWRAIMRSCGTAASGTNPKKKTSIHSAPAERHEATGSALSPGGRCRTTSCTPWQ